MSAPPPLQVSQDATKGPPHISSIVSVKPSMEPVAVT